MSNHDATPDPLDKAYAEAEAVLRDDAERAARRARVLAAAAQAPARIEALPGRKSAWGNGRWLVAACVAGLGVFVATQTFTPHTVQLPAAAPAMTAPSVTPSVTPPNAPPVADAPAESRVVTKAPVPAAPKTPAPAPAVVASTPLPAPPPVMAAAPAPQAFPNAPAPAPPPPPPAANDASAAGDRAAPVNRKAEALEAAPRPSVPLLSRGQAALAARPMDNGARLRAAALAGQVAEVENLLAQGAPVDGADAQGVTALMQAIKADHPAVAVLLKGHGASLDRKTKAGERARDMVAAVGDAELAKALGLAPSD